MLHVHYIIIKLIIIIIIIASVSELSFLYVQAMNGHNVNIIILS